MEAALPVRPACYLPRPTSDIEHLAFRLRSRRAALTVVELFCLALFVGGVLATALAFGA